MFVLLFAFANNQATYTITAAQFDQCDSNNKGLLGLSIQSENPITVPLDFVLTLKGEKEIQAQCVMEGIPTNKPIITPSEKPEKPGTEGIPETGKVIPETKKEATGEVIQKTDKEKVFDSILENTDEAKKSSDEKEEPFQSTLENTDEAKKSSDEKEEPFESTLENTDEAKKSSDEKESSEGSEETKTSSVKNSDFVSDNSNDDENLSDQETLDSTDVSNQSRRLQGVSTYEYKVTCTYEPPEKEGSYKLEKTDSGVKISGDIALSLIPCLSQDQARERANISLSFRQVNKFDKINFIFWFYALSSRVITDQNFFIRFYIYLMKGFTRAPEPVEITCPIKSGANPEESTLGIYPVSFECSLPEGTSHEGYDSIEIDSSNDVAGFPTNSTFMNPMLTDEAIANGDIKDAAEAEIPTFVEIKEDTLNFDLEKGSMEMSIPFSNEDLIKDKIHKTFEIPLAYPSGVTLFGKILSFLNGFLRIEFEIKGAIDNQPLIWEQSIISIGGDELFIMPGFQTEAITTEGYTETNPEEEEEEEKGLTSDKIPEEGKSDKTHPEHEDEKNTDELISDQGGEGRSDRIPPEPEKEGKTEEILIPPTIPEGIKERANMSLSFRQVNKFDIETFKFWFYGLSSEIITDENFSIIFVIYLIGDSGKSPDPIDATCLIKSGFNPEDTEASLFPVSFECSLPEGTSHEGYTSIEIDSSNDVAGLPTNSTLLNPALMDEAIANGEFIDAEKAAVPTLVEIKDGDLKFDLEKGTFPLEVPFNGEFDFEITGKTFEISLVYPSGVMLIGNILSFLNNILNIEFAINGKIENQPLIWEQTVISVEGVELFVMPGFETEPITTEGFNQTSSEEEDEEEPEKEGKGEEEPEKGEKGEEEPEKGEKGEEEPEKEGKGEEEPEKEGKGEEEPEKGEKGEKGEEEPEKEGKGEEEPEKEGKGEEEPEKGEKGEEEPEKEQTSDEAFSSDETTSDQASSEEITTQQETSTQSGSEQTESTETSQTNGTEYEGISEEDAALKAEIVNSFRQISGFVNSGTKITFNLYTLTTQSLETGNTVILFVNLIGLSGMEEETTEAQCTLSNDVTVSGQTSVQADYGCKIENVNAAEAYTSLRLNSSNDITGIPTDDETALNPALTDQAILNNEVKDCSKDSSVPPTFGNIEVDQSRCASEGRLFINGELSEEKPIAGKFTIPLTYPEGISLTCTYKVVGIECFVDKSIDNETIIVEQTIIANGADELFVLSNFSDSEIVCGNGLEIQAKEKTNVGISFRQVSHIEKINDIINFFFAAFINANLPASYSQIVNVVLNVGDEKFEREATCVLNEAVTVSGEPIQGDFNCSIELDSEEEKIPLENLTISTNNDKIGGCAELTKEESCPKATDDAISDSGNAESELGVTVDYYKDENKNKKPPSLKLSTFDLSRCEKGKLKVTGTLSEAISEEMTFELPFSYPSSKVKCTIEPSDATEVEISCKIQKTKKNGFFNSFVIEPRLLKKKRKEMLFIEGSTGSYGIDTKCENFNEVKLRRAKARKAAPFSFLQLGRPSGYAFFFFMALMKKSASTNFATTTLSISVIHSGSSRMRLLDTTDETDLDVECEVGTTTDNSGVLNCKDSSGMTPLKIDLNDDTVGGIPDDAPVQTNPTPNLLEKANLETIDSLPVVTVTNLKSNNCSQNGSYVIEATSDKELSFTTKEKITIPFSSPDSDGLCSITVTSGTKLTMNCENTQAFSASELIIPGQVIKDEDDETPLFKIEDYTAPVQFACAISDRSLKVAFPANYTDPNGNSPADTDSTSSLGYARHFRNGSSSGLGGGAIAGIVISIIAVAVIVGVFIALAKKGILGGSAAASNAAIDNNSTINRFNINSQNANVV